MITAKISSTDISGIVMAESGWKHMTLKKKRDFMIIILMIICHIKIQKKNKYKKIRRANIDDFKIR